ncbi:aspartate/glutamate racemase family protein [Leucobacter sp. VD1]|uniref:aspartate/glutamate racemase family protein n=1 Tax=Leucobacter sp. VD1 TaxID=3080381 RepID=UPI00301602D6
MSAIRGGDRAVIGVLGGMGPAATADFYAKIVQATPAQRDQDHPRTLIWSDPSIPDRTGALLASGPHPGPQLAAGARMLERSGADVIAVPCNTAHAFLPEIRAAVGIPVLDMVLETRNRVWEMLEPGGRAGLLATDGTIRARLYEEAFAQRDEPLLVPDAAQQARVMEAIRQVKGDPVSAAAAQTLCAAVAELAERGAGVVIAGCTEIPVALAAAEGLAVPVVDSTEVLAQAAVQWALTHSSSKQNEEIERWSA